MRFHSAKLALALSGALLLSACSQFGPLSILNAITPEDGYRIVAGIAYGDDPRQSMDLYQPVEPNGGPLIVFVYGGAWRDGSREEYKFVGQTFATEGYTVVIPDYRLYPRVRYPAIIDDVRDAIEFLRENSEDLTVSTERIVLAGHSSGAHAAALLASSDRYFKGKEFIVGLIGLSGPYDLPLDHADVANIFKDIEDPAQVKPPALVETVHPPTLLLHGADDRRVIPRHTKRYAARLQEADVPVEIIFLEGVGHAGILVGLSTRLQFLNETREHLLSYMSGLK